MRLFIMTSFMMFIATSAWAACDPGYYGASCTRCPSGSYCPDGVNIYDCPPITTDWYALFASIGTTDITQIIDVKNTSFNPSTSGPASSDRHCYAQFAVITRRGELLAEVNFNGTEYWNTNGLYWRYAYKGYYVASYIWTSANGIANYRDIKPCTNAPEYAHYTGPGTPDEPVTGGRTDYNDCPWECDSGYGLHNRACVTLCDAGFTKLKASSGASVNAYPTKYSIPALNISTPRGTCYVTLSSGAATGAINILYDGRPYHTTD